MRSWLVLIVCVAACGSGGGAPDPDAAVDASSCDETRCAPFACDPRDGRCFRACEDPSMCADGYDCVARACAGTECTEETAGESCGPYACVNGVCATDCGIGPCGDGYYCRGDTLECVPRCASREDVLCEGYLCDLEVGECESYCLDGELGCAPGYRCDATSHCVVDTPP